MHKSTKWLLGEVVVAAVLIALLGIYHHPLLFSRQWHRLLHIVGAVLLLGNIIVTAAWMYLAERTNNPLTLRYASETANWADVFFTVPGVFLIITNGDILAGAWGGVFKTGGSRSRSACSRSPECSGPVSCSGISTGSSGYRVR